MGVADKCLAVLFSTLILGQAYAVRLWVGTWLFPACLFGIFWFAYTFIPLLLLFPVPVDPYAVAYIFLCTLALSIGSLPFNWQAAFKANQLKAAAAPPYGNGYLTTAFNVTALAALACIALDLASQGFTAGDVLFDLPTTAASYANLLYSDSRNINVFGRLAPILGNVAPALGGLLLHSKSSRFARMWIVTASFLPAAIVAVTETTKGLLFFCIATFYAGILIARLSAGSLQLMNKGARTTIVLYACTVVSIILAAFLLRGIGNIQDTDVLLGTLVFYIVSYTCGHMYAFADWFAFAIGRHSLLVYHDELARHGLYTFTGFFALLGNDRQLPQGIYDDLYSDGKYLGSNVYTMFRGLILDFGIPGSLLFMLLLGLFFHWVFRILLSRPRPVASVAMFIFMVEVFYNSYIVSALSWTRVYVVLILLCAILQINKLFNSSGLWFKIRSALKPR